jgi:predicted kinase/GNAT superfamily N-acetyltransferase
MTARLVVVTGLPGSGKTTLATEVAARLGAVRFCPDDWMTSAGLDLWDADARDRIERFQGELAMDLLASGRPVVIEWGTWSRAERDALRDAARGVGSAVELRACTAPVDELWRRIVERDREGRWASRAITREELDGWVDRYEAPTADELVTYDPPIPLVADVEEPAAVTIRRLERVELSRIADIDRTERIESLYEQRGTELIERRGTWTSAPWDPVGRGEHSVWQKERDLEGRVDAGGVALGAFVGARLVGLGVVKNGVRPGMAQLGLLHVSAPWRGRGVGVRLCEEMDRTAREAGCGQMVVSSAPTGNTVRFYLRRGFRPMAEPLAELFEAEPEDVHMHRTL